MSTDDYNLVVGTESLYRERIAGSGPLLVFLHHGLGSVSLWRDFPRRLAQATGCGALLYDRCGHGKSEPCLYDRQPDYLHREAAHLRNLLASENPSEVILIGHSDGGTIALLYAAMPDVPQPRGIISEASHLFVEDVTRAGIRVAVDAYSNGMREKLMRHHGANTGRLFWDWAGGWLSPRFDSFDIRNQLRAVHCPVLALQGLDDEYGTLAQVRALQEAVSGPFAEALIPHCGHEPHIQQPEATFTAMSLVIAQW